MTSEAARAPWQVAEVSAYLQSFFTREFMSARDRFAMERPKLDAEAARRGVGRTPTEAFLVQERAAAAWVAFPALVEEIKRLVGAGKVPPTEAAKAFAFEVVGGLKAQIHGDEPARAAARATADLRLFFDEQALPAATTGSADPYAEKGALDVLLPLLARDTFDRDLPEAVGAATARHPCALLFLDIDHFKRVNDDEGHQTGDKVLVEVASRFRAVVGGKGRCYRYGGEELTAIVENYTSAEAIVLAERVRASIADEPIVAKTRTVSVGAAVAPEHAGTAEDLVGAADRAMYAAKKASRNAVSLPQGPHG